MAEYVLNNVITLLKMYAPEKLTALQKAYPDATFTLANFGPGETAPALEPTPASAALSSGLTTVIPICENALDAVSKAMDRRRAIETGGSVLTAISSAGAAGVILQGHPQIGLALACVSTVASLSAPISANLGRGADLATQTAQYSEAAVNLFQAKRVLTELEATSPTDPKFADLSKEGDDLSNTILGFATKYGTLRASQL